MKVFLIAAAFASAATAAQAGDVYVALGDSITFGETDLNYVQSYGDRGYVSLVANQLAARNGVRPAVVNLAIDGETATSFFSNAGRTPPVVGRGDAPLQLENLNYNNGTAISQSQAFANTVAAETSAGNTIGTISLTLGFNELAALSPTTNTAAAEAAALAQVPAELAAFKANDTKVLADIRALAPAATLDLIGYYNPFPADPASPAAPLFDQYGMALDGIIQGLAAQFGANYINAAPGFVGQESALTYLAAQPSGSSVGGQYGGVLPIGNVHPNAAGYGVIASAFAAPEPSPWAILLTGVGLAALIAARQPAPPVRARPRGIR